MPELEGLGSLVQLPKVMAVVAPHSERPVVELPGCCQEALPAVGLPQESFLHRLPLLCTAPRQGQYRVFRVLMLRVFFVEIIKFNLSIKNLHNLVAGQILIFYSQFFSW